MTLNKSLKKFLLPLIVFVAFMSLILYGLACFYPLWAPCRTAEIYIKNSRFKVEIADTVSRRTRGLMYRKNLPTDGGMLFVFESEGEHAFWMKNTFIPLDILWLDSNGTILHIVKNAAPWPRGNPPVINPPGIKSKYVLELKGGTISEIAVKVGDKVILPSGNRFSS